MPELAETIRIAEDLHKEGLRYLNDIEITPLGEVWLTKKGLDTNRLADIRNVGVNFHAFGKQIVLEFKYNPHQMIYAAHEDENPSEFLRISLGMTGRFKMDEHLTETDKKHILFTMSFFEGTAHFIDYRKFFQIEFVDQEFLVEKSKKSLLNLDFGMLYVMSNVDISPITNRPKIVELLDEGKYTGVGNYLANEGLGRVKMDPRTPFANQDEKEYLMKTLQGVALESYAAGGHSFNGGFIRPNGETGYFKPQIYGNGNLKRETFRGRPIWITQE